MRYAVLASLLLALALPAPAEGRCRRYANTARLGTPVLHKQVFATTMSAPWCFDGRRVTRLGRVRLYPSLTRLGTLAGWEFRGVAAGDDRALVVRGRRRRAYRVRRVVHWRRCAGRCYHLYLEMNSFLYWDGRAARANRVRRG